MPYGSVGPEIENVSTGQNTLYTGIPKITCCARAHANREIFRQFRSLCKHLKYASTWPK